MANNNDSALQVMCQELLIEGFAGVRQEKIENGMQIVIHARQIHLARVCFH
jgi:hypothetical protein